MAAHATMTPPTMCRASLVVCWGRRTKLVRASAKRANHSVVIVHRLDLGAKLTVGFFDVFRPSDAERSSSNPKRSVVAGVPRLLLFDRLLVAPRLATPPLTSLQDGHGSGLDVRGLELASAFRLPLLDAPPGVEVCEPDPGSLSFWTFSSYFSRSFLDLISACVCGIPNPRRLRVNATEPPKWKASSA